MATSKSRSPLARWLKPLAFLLLAIPLLWILWKWAMLAAGDYQALGANPINTTIRFLGDTAIRVLLAALAVTPAAKITGWKPLMRVRRMVGLWAFAYVILHATAYLGMDLLFSLSALWEDILKRRYITVGMLALLLMVPLAVTSTNKMVKRLGGRRWQRLHRVVYAVGALAVLHHFMMVKGNQQGPWLHLAILAVLLGYRMAAAGGRRYRRQRRAAAPAMGPEAPLAPGRDHAG